MAEIRGINLAMQTPFNDDGSVSYSRFEELIDIYIDCGMHGLVFSSGTGQHAYLTEEECIKLFSLGITRVGGRVPAICQTSALNLDEIARRSKCAEDLGADAIMVLPPYLEGPTHDDGIFAFYERVNEAVSIDIIGYNIPQATGIELSAGLFKRLNELEHFNYIKDSSGDFAKQQVLLATGGTILNGADPTTPFSLMAGCTGAIWGCANFFPREAVRLYDLVQAKKVDEATALWARMFPSVAYCWFNDYMPAVKAACREMGFDGGTVRAPVCEIGPDEEAKLAAALAPLKGEASLREVG
jgi:4-hydroxy-tetrahydrodipicolinate synthase